MRTLLAVMLAFLPLVEAQDSVLKSIEPDYAKYNPELAADFSTATPTVTLTVANGRALSLDSYIPLPMAVVMALKDYEFQPPATIPQGRTDSPYQVTLNLPIRQSKKPRPEIAVGAGLAAGMAERRVRAVYPEAAKEARIQGKVEMKAVIDEQGDVETVEVINGRFALIEAAYDAVKQWHFRPYLENRKPVEVVADIHLVFSLD